MRLAQIKLAGFKSFVDPTAIDVPHDLVGIVGPNGCGKSNIIDAVRWVLGESKASALRGDSMQDVIFTGSDNRKAVSRASVELVFDNQSSRITGQWSTYSEIAIKRVLRRDGQSAYYINNLHVRRRDIADLFLGTGVGGRGYAIIEQGMISRIIEAKPQELKSFLEEAAGISQYRERRQETSSRLTEAQKNLTRLEDIRQELITQLAHLEVQAQKAQRYTQLQDELHKSQALLWLQRKSEALRQRQIAEKNILELETELASVLLSQQNAETTYEAVRAAGLAANDQLLQVQGQLYAADAEIGRLEQQIKHLQDTHDRIVQQIQQIESQLQKNNQLKNSKAENLVHWHQEKTKAEAIHQQCTVNSDEENTKLPAIEASFHACQEQLNECRRHLLVSEQAIELEQSHLTHSAKNIQQLESRRARLLKEQQELIPVDPVKLAGLQTTMQQIEDELQQGHRQRQSIDQRLTAANQNKQQITRNTQELQHKLSQAAARYNALQNLQQKLENNQAISTWLNKHQWQALPRLWQHIQVEPEWENALEAVLREQLNSIELKQLEDILHWIEEIPAGKWAIFEAGNNEQSTDDAPAGTHSSQRRQNKLLSYITIHRGDIQPVLKNWLREVFAIESIQEGLSLRATLSQGEILVTPQGHMITRHNLTFYAPDSQLHGVLSRQKEQNQLRKEIDQLETQLQQLGALLAEADQQCSESEQAIQLANSHTKHLQQQLHQLQLESVKLTQIHERATHRQNQIGNELSEIQQALDAEISARESARTRHQINLKQIETLKTSVQQAQSAWESANRELANQRQKMLQSSKELQEAVFQIQTCQNKIQEIGSHIQSIDHDVKQLTGQHRHLLSETANLDAAPVIALLEAAQAKRKLIEQEASQARQAVDTTAQELRQLENTRMVAEQKSHTLREAINQARLKEQAASMTIRQFDELLENAGIAMEQLQAAAEKKTAAALQADINRLNAGIAALGAVNLAALEELEAAQARESDLLTQLQDLNTAIATLDHAIQQIDRETQLRLHQTFNLVNQYLSEIFPVIFTGGNARLEFSGDQTVDAGLLLMAQPPGKKNSSIHLLSGGEKALTALALIFSLFRLNPAPFCLLDEVDAPLDDSNTGRFCELVKNMAKQTQFIFISHNKITMEMAQRLIGVTMQEQGVSRIVAVDLADAIKMGKRDQLPVNE